MIDRIKRESGETPERLIDIIKTRKLKFFGHQIRREALSKNIIQGKVQGRRPRGRPKREWQDDIKEWTGDSLAALCRAASDRSDWKMKVFRWVHPRPNRLR